MKFGVTDRLDVVICDNPDDATANGYTYREGFQPVRLDTAVVVHNGTVSGKPTIDLILRDIDGNKYVTMITAALLKAIPC